ncbi:MAG: glutathione S-transferase family protein [Acetobacteraceae bacterium]
MLYYDSIGPNPKVVRMFMAERGITGIPTETVDLRGGENRREPYLSKNPSGQCPALALDDGMILAEITAICEYLDEVGPAGKTLIGSTPEERAETRMWTRRIDLNIVEPMANGFRFSDGIKLFQDRIRCIPQAADDLKKTAQEKLTWLDGLIAGRKYICGDRLTLADILLFCFLDFFANVKQPINQDNRNIVAWYERMKALPSAAV